MKGQRAVVCRGRADADGKVRRLVCAVNEEDEEQSQPGPQKSIGSATAGSILIGQRDFAKGTLRLKTPGLYFFKENVTFNAPVETASTRADTPVNGFWFAAISIETDGVIIDGRGYKLSVALAYNNKNLAGTFAVILLGNNQFSGGLFGGGGARFPDTTAYVAADNVLISNLTIVGNGAHFGIMGNNNTIIGVNNCSIYDCQVANTYLQSSQGASLTNIKYFGSTTPVTITQEVAQLSFMRKIYADLAAQAVAMADTRRAALEAYVAANPTRFAPPPQSFPTSNVGLFITPGPTALFPFPMTPEAVAVDASLVDAFYDGEYNENLLVSNCSFTNFKSFFKEIVAIGTNIPTAPIFPLNSWPLILFGMFGTMEWKDAFNSSGVFKPNDFLKAIVFIMNHVWPSLGPLQGLLPANSLAVFDSILTSNAAKFFSNAAPLVSRQSDGLGAKGLFAIRAIAVDRGVFNNIKIINEQSLGPAPVVPSALPGYSKVTQPQEVTRTQGNDLWAVSLESCENTAVNNVTIDGQLNKHGYIFGVDLAESDSNVIVSSSSMSNATASNTKVTPTMDAGDIFGFVVDDNTGTIILKDLTTRNLKAGGTVTHFEPAKSTPPQIITINCRAL